MQHVLEHALPQRTLVVRGAMFQPEIATSNQLWCGNVPATYSHQCLNDDLDNMGVTVQASTYFPRNDGRGDCRGATCMCSYIATPISIAIVVSIAEAHSFVNV
jgi:hypothetical protein